MFNAYKMTPALMVVYIFVILLIARALYKAFFTPLKTAKDYVNRANFWVSYFRMHDKSIQVLKKALLLPTVTKDETYMLNFRIGVAFYFKKDYKAAVEYFDKTLDFFKRSVIPFDKFYQAMIISYYNNGDAKTARWLYHTLKKQEANNMQFASLTALDKRIFK